MLFDFDLAGPGHGSASGGASGTLGYASPEALVGARGPAGDLFSLGALLYEAWTGAPPFGVGIEAVQRMLSGRAPQLSTVRDGLPPAWDAILAKLLEPRPEDRHPSARELLREIARAGGGEASPVDLDLRAPHPEGDPLAGIFVGRRIEREALHTALERLAEGTVARSVIVVVGSLGAGRRALIELAMRDARIESAARMRPGFDVIEGDLRAVAAHVRAPEAERRRLTRLRARRARAKPTRLTPRASASGASRRLPTGSTLWRAGTRCASCCARTPTPRRSRRSWPAPSRRVDCWSWFPRAPRWRVRSRR